MHAFKPFGLTPSQAFMLRTILAKQSITGTDLSVELNISKATCSRTLDGLIKLEFVNKVQASADARSFELHASPKAQRIQDELNQASGKVTKKLKGIIGSDSFEQIVKNLRNISNSFK